MLGSRTKQIAVYGKRSRRVVDATHQTSAKSTSTNEITSIFDDLPPPPPKTGTLASKMKKRENAMPQTKAKAKVASPKVIPVGLQKKKKLSPVLSPPKKARIDEVLLKAKAKASAAQKSRFALSPSPTRPPLSAVPLNFAASPVVPQKSRLKAGQPQSKLKKPFSPFVDVDIIVVDDNGRTLHAEKRLERTDVVANPIRKPKSSKRSLLLSSDSEAEISTLPRRPQRRGARQRIVISDDSDQDSGDDYAPLSDGVVIPQEREEERISEPPKKKLGGRSTVIEVSIPPAPYPTGHRRLLETISKASVERSLPQSGPTQFKSIPSPVHKPRQLTPIRNGARKGLFEPASPPSPTTPTDLDFSIDFSELCLSTELETQTTVQSDFDTPDYLLPLLKECHQEGYGPHNFSAFIESFPYDPILQASRASESIDMRFRKIGEASYSEVFGIGDVVLKVVPLRDESKEGLSETVDGPAPTDAKDVQKEIVVTRAMGDVYGGFVKLLKTYVVRGRYPEVLLQLWDQYNERKGSESVRPDSFKVSQIYAIIVLPNGGPDLEAYTFPNAARTGWRQAASIFWQVAKSLAHAEHLVSFEHRDLHWGQILVKNHPSSSNPLKVLNPNQRSKPRSSRVFMDDFCHGVEAIVIDLGLSRMDAGDGTDGEPVHWTPFDEEVFMGEGDYQYDVYRMMRETTGEDWSAFHPVTNVLWLHYLLQKLLHFKGLKPPPVPRKPKGAAVAEAPPLPALAGMADNGFSEKDSYECLLDIDSWLGKAIAETFPKTGKFATKSKARRKTQPAISKTSSFSSIGPSRAGEIVEYGVKKGWIKTTLLF